MTLIFEFSSGISLREKSFTVAKDKFQNTITNPKTQIPKHKYKSQNTNKKLNKLDDVLCVGRSLFMPAGGEEGRGQQEYRLILFDSEKGNQRKFC